MRTCGDRYVSALSTWLVLTLLGLSVILTGCGGEQGAQAGTISRETFIEVNVALRQIEADTAVIDSVRAEVLDDYDVSTEELRAFIEAWSGDTEALAEIWDEIRERLEAEIESADGDAADLDRAASDTVAGDTVAPDTTRARQRQDTAGIRRPPPRNPI